MGRGVSWIVLVIGSAVVTGQASEEMTIHGQVIDYLSQPVAGAEVALIELDGDGFFRPKSVTLLETVSETDPEGSFHFESTDTARNDLLVVARKQGLAIGWKYLDRDKLRITQSQRTLTLVLDKPHEITGRLIDTQGRPVNGATVQICPLGRGAGLITGPRSWFMVETDSQGAFRFWQLPRDPPVQLYVTLSGRDLCLIYPPRPGLGNDARGYQVDWMDVELTLPDTETFNGRVVDKITGQAVSGIRLLLLPESDRTCQWRFRDHAIVSGSDGHIKITGVPSGRHELRFIQPDSGRTDWVGSNTLISIPSSAEDQPITLRVAKGIPLEIRTQEAKTGRPLASMKVFIQPAQSPTSDQYPGFVQSTRTDLQGSVRLFVPPGQHRVHAWGDNYQGPQEGVAVDVVSDRMAPLSIPLSPWKPSIRGSVVDEQGRPVEGVLVQIEDGEQVVTDSQGRFAGQQSPIYPAHQVTAWDVENKRTGFCRIQQASRPVKIVLKPCLTITGRIVDAAGQGISAAQVWIRLEYHGRTPQSSRSFHLAGGITDFHGFYKLDRVLPLQGPYRRYDYRIDAGAIGYGRSSQSFTRAGQAGDTLTAPDLQLVALDGSITGILLDRSGQPLARQNVLAFSDTGNHSVFRSTHTDDLGRFVINRIAQGPVQLQARSSSGKEHTILNAHSGDHVQFTVSGGKHTFRPRSTRVGCPLPDLSKMEIAFDPRRIENKQALVCLVDITQRPSQCSLSYLNNLQDFCRRKGVALVCIQVTPIEEETLAAWKKENKITLPIEILPGAGEAVQQQWGVRSLPWLTLTDRDHRITEEGFQTARIGQFIKDNIGNPLLQDSNRSTRRRRRR